MTASAEGLAFSVLPRQERLTPCSSAARRFRADVTSGNSVLAAAIVAFRWAGEEEDAPGSGPAVPRRRAGGSASFFQKWQTPLLCTNPGKNWAVPLLPVEVCQLVDPHRGRRHLPTRTPTDTIRRRGPGTRRGARPPRRTPSATLITPARKGVSLVAAQRGLSPSWITSPRRAEATLRP